MPLTLSGTNGVSGIDGSAGTPAVRGGTSSSNGVFYGTNTVSIATNSTTAVTVDSSQNVGIGTTSPNYNSVTGTVVHINNSAAGAWTVNRYTNGSTGSAATDGAIIGMVGTTGYLFNYENDAIIFGTNSTERMRIDSSGNLLVGDTSNLVSGVRLYSKSGSTTNPAMLASTGVTGDVAQAAFYISKFDNNSTTSQVFAKFYINNAGAACGQINANGAGAAAFGSTSDARLKENIVSVKPQLSNICALKPCEFDFKDGSGHQIGFIAQEMQEVYPDTINENSDGFLTITGWSKTEARLVKAIQELSAKVQELEEKIAKYETGRTTTM